MSCGVVCHQVLWHHPLVMPAIVLLAFTCVLDGHWLLHSSVPHQLAAVSCHQWIVCMGISWIRRERIVTKAGEVYQELFPVVVTCGVKCPKHPRFMRCYARAQLVLMLTSAKLCRCLSPHERLGATRLTCKITLHHQHIHQPCWAWQCHPDLAWVAVVSHCTCPTHVARQVLCLRVCLRPAT
jgi:hypothetical protein